jgi:hypothetical protein
MKKIIHIAPALPPAINGLGDFCKILADNLGREGYTDNWFMIRRNARSEPDKRIQSFKPHTFYDVLQRQKADVVILHYVGYAYEKRGMPFYIVNGLKKYKRRTSCRLLVFFHELYSSSNSLFDLSFYTSGFQKIIVRELGDMADTLFTNCGVYRELLQRILGSDTIQPICTGIFSNVPDELYDQRIGKEENSMVVFGSAHKRNAVYDHRRFAELVQQLGINTLYDVGPGDSHCHLPKVKVHTKGSLSSGELASCLNAVEFGALSYPPHLLAKSGIFSAYTAFGVIPLNLTVTDGTLCDGLVEGRNYFTWRPETIPEVFNYDIAREEILKWYHTHDQKIITERFKTYL